MVAKENRCEAALREVTLQSGYWTWVLLGSGADAVNTCGEHTRLSQAAAYRWRLLVALLVVSMTHRELRRVCGISMCREHREDCLLTASTVTQEVSCPSRHRDGGGQHLK